MSIIPRQVTLLEWDTSIGVENSPLCNNPEMGAVTQASYYATPSRAS